MRPSLKTTAIGLCWLVAVAAVAITTAQGQQQERDALGAGFSDRASTSAASVAAYVQDVFERQTRMAVSLRRRVSDDGLDHERVAAGFATSVLLDSQGQVLSSSPPGPTVHGDDLSGLDPHIFEALTGQPAVSGVMASAVGPIVEFALPLNEDGSRVLASGFVLADSPLFTFLSVPPIAGARGYIADELGNALVFAGAGATDAMEGTASQRALDEPVVVEDRVMVSTPIEQTSWRLVLTAPQSAVVAPATADDWVEWSVIVVTAVLILCALLVLRSVNTARQRSQAAQMEAEQSFRLTVDNAPIGMLLVALDGRILRANSRFCTMLCYENEELLQMTVRDITHPDDVAEAGALLHELALDESSYYEGEKRYLRGDGVAVWVRLSISVVRDAHGKPLHFVSQSEDVTEVRAAQEQLEQRALYDGLTGLANRGLLIDRLTHALVDHRRDGAMLAVAFCDLDHFKRIHDSLGHHAGDLVLQEVARRLQGVVRDSDTVARVGGDEFVVLLPRVSSIETATAILDRAKAALDEPIEIEGDSILMSLSSGVAIAEASCTADR
jgi:diguanylate cyclase (GGDEF)-like protein/PAS domain S-box-containing protein